MKARLINGLCAAALALTGLGATAAVAPAAHAATAVPRYDHVVIVMDENESQSEVIGSSAAPYINSLAAGGANFTNSDAITHPSEPNYLALFSGSTQGVTADTCPVSFGADNLGNQLRTAGLSFTGYAEDLPSVGSEVCTSGEYARKHVPWTDFTDLPASVNQPFTSFPSNFANLPTVSWVTPNLCDDIHDCSVATGDAWLQANMGAYATWAKTHNSLLIFTFDEDDGSVPNHIATIFYGAGITPGNYGEAINHYSVLRTLEAMYGLPYLANAATANTITDVWGTAAASAPTITSVSPASAAAGQVVTVTGTGFGASQGSGYVTFTDAPSVWGAPTDKAVLTIDSWSDTSVTFTVPTPQDRGAWHVNPGTTATFSVTSSAGQVSNVASLGIVA
jgi:hypothetical protein